MKSAPRILLLVAILVAAAVAWGFWSHHDKPTVVPAPRPPDALAQALAERASRSRRPMVSEWQEYHVTREQTLRDNPELAAEYKALLNNISKQDADMDAAMVKADPSVAPILAKLIALRQRTIVSAPPATQ